MFLSGRGSRVPRIRFMGVESQDWNDLLQIPTGAEGVGPWSQQPQRILESPILDHGRDGCLEDHLGGVVVGITPSRSALKLLTKPLPMMS